jgi:hypothetical protein
MKIARLFGKCLDFPVGQARPGMGLHELGGGPRPGFGADSPHLDRKILFEGFSAAIAFQIVRESII